MPTNIYRAWINQPSKFDALHSLHAMRCIAVDNGGTTLEIYFTEGPVHSMLAPRHSIACIPLSSAG